MFCRHCGTENTEESRFCRSCGSEIIVSREASRVDQVSQMKPELQENEVQINTKIEFNKPHCPNCGSESLQAVVETDVKTTGSGGGYSAGSGCLGFLLFGPLGLLCGSCGSNQTVTTNTTNKSFWVCNDCGNKFRNKRDELEELNTNMKQFKGLNVLGIICIFFGLGIVLSLGGAQGSMSILAIFWVLGGGCILLGTGASRKTQRRIDEIHSYINNRKK